ncbi:hypothetical protein [Corallococcus silvisoli]|uniref:hypothetical protein n=1 Tax=Corallococcus silvisoli TaxID=2697031 RepID=UPI0013782B8C|nr:hypothetical protein [Corallococcus silvisoli]NBD09634.1 hypothetical protein [Corallococcus silvisoli]
MNTRDLLSRYERVNTVDVTAQREPSARATEGYLQAGPGAGVYLEPLGDGASYPVRIVPDGDNGRAFVLPYPAFVAPGPWRSLRVEGVLPGSRWRLLLASDAGAVAAAPPLTGWTELMRTDLWDTTWVDGRRYYLPDRQGTVTDRRALHTWDVSSYRAVAVLVSLRELAVEEGTGLMLRLHHLTRCDYDGAMRFAYVPNSPAKSDWQVAEVAVGPLGPANGTAASIYVGEGVAAVSTVTRAVVPERWRYVALSVQPAPGSNVNVLGDPAEVVMYGVR